MKKIFITLLCFIIISLGNVWAADLSSAKSQGLIGETPRGYLEAVNSPSAEIQNLINSINAQRKDRYSSIAESNGTSLSAVEKVAGEKAMRQTKSGNFIKVNGAWKKK